MLDRNELARNLQFSHSTYKFLQVNHSTYKFLQFKHSTCKFLQVNHLLQETCKILQVNHFLQETCKFLQGNHSVSTRVSRNPFSSLKKFTGPQRSINYEHGKISKKTWKKCNFHQKTAKVLDINLLQTCCNHNISCRSFLDSRHRNTLSVHRSLTATYIMSNCGHTFKLN